MWLVDLGAHSIGPDAEALLTAAERQRAERFQHPDDRGRFVAGRVWLRALAAHHLGTSAGDVELDHATDGRPVLRAHPSLHLSGSHSGSVVAVAVARCPIGVDVEQQGALVVDDLLAARVCSRRERASLGAVSPEARAELFLRWWVRKEALVKACGVAGREDLVAVDVRRALTSVGGRWWRLRELVVPAGHRGVVAVPLSARPVVVRTVVSGSDPAAPVVATRPGGRSP